MNKRERGLYEFKETVTQDCGSQEAEGEGMTEICGSQEAECEGMIEICGVTRGRG